MARLPWIVIACLALTYGGSVARSQDLPSTRPKVIQIEVCKTALIEQIQVPAREPGQLEKLTVKEGMRIRKDAHVGQIYNRDAWIESKLSVDELVVAMKRADDDSKLKAALAAWAVAQQESRQAQELLRRGGISKMEVEKIELQRKQAELESDVARNELEIARVAVAARRSQVDAAGEKYQRRMIMSPVSGVIETVYKREGEWVNPGDPVFEIVRLDTLRVEGFVNIREAPPAEIKGRPVEVVLDNVLDDEGRPIKLTSHVCYTGSQIDASGDYRVCAEVAQPEGSDGFPIRAGMRAAMTIHITESPDPAVSDFVPEVDTSDAPPLPEPPALESEPDMEPSAEAESLPMP